MKQLREDLHKVAWRYLNLLRTPKGARYRLEDSGRSLILTNERSETLSIVTNAAFEAYEDYQTSQSIISLYYMCFKLIQALLVATSPRTSGLSQLQNSSKQGHGIKMYLKDSKHFPRGISFWYQRGGMFSDLIKSKGWGNSIVKKDKQSEIEKLIENNDEETLTTNNIFNVSDLITRIPELKIYLYELRVGKPLYFRTSQGEGINDPGAEIYFEDEEWRNYNLSTIKRFVSQYNRPTAGYNETMAEMHKFSPRSEVVFHYSGDIEIPLYNYWVVKLGNVNNMLAIYFTLLYILSILVRYYPQEWSRMTMGENSIYPLVNAFSELSLNGISTWICNEIFGQKVVV